VPALHNAISETPDGNPGSGYIIGTNNRRWSGEVDIVFYNRDLNRNPSGLIKTVPTVLHYLLPWHDQEKTEPESGKITSLFKPVDIHQ
jgi:hypothetical protein